MSRDRDVAEHARDDAPALEGGAVLAHRLLGAGAARDVRVALGDIRLRAAASRRSTETGTAGCVPARAADVDLELPLASDPDGHARTLTGVGARIAAMSSYPAAKRMLDVTVSVLLLVLLSPVFAFVLVAMGVDMLRLPRATAARGSIVRRASRAAASSTS